MTLRLSFQMLSCAVALSVADLALAVETHTGKLVQFVQPAGVGGGCMWLTLVGVTEADPVARPGSPWFAIPLTHPGAKEIFAIVAMAKLSEKTVTVRTASTSACGYAAVDYVMLE